MGGGREAGTGKKEGGVWREGRRVLQGDSWKFLGRLLEGSEEKCARGGEKRKGKQTTKSKRRLGALGCSRRVPWELFESSWVLPGAPWVLQGDSWYIVPEKVAVGPGELLEGAISIYKVWSFSTNKR